MKKLFMLIIIALVIMQFIPLDQENPEYDPKTELNAEEEVMAVFKKSCYDCHSNETVWPWYSKVAPVSYLVTDHVNEGRSELNFSIWKTYDRDKRIHKMEEIWEEVEEGEMPMEGYALIHGIKLTEEEKAIIKDWSEKLVIF